MPSSLKARRFLEGCFILIISILLSSPTLAVDLSAGSSWLRARQNVDGSWGGTEFSTVRQYQATAAVIEALQNLNDTGSSLQDGKTWLAGRIEETAEETVWECGLIGLDPLFASTSCTDLQSLMQVGGWGVGPTYPIEVLDTALALDALAITGLNDPDRIQGAIGFLLSAQRNDGGWGYGENFSNVSLTAEVLGALVPHSALFQVEDPIQRALAFLRAEYHTGGTIGEGLIETAAAYRGAIEAGENVAASFPATSTYLQGSQAVDGSWEEDEYTTALVLMALSLEKPNLVIRSSDVMVSLPFPSEGDVVAINVQVHNLGPMTAGNVQVRFFDGDPLDAAAAIGEPIVLAAIPAYGSASVTAIWNTAGRAGNRRITVQADPGNTITELTENDNSAEVIVTVATRPDLVLGQGDILASPAFPTPSDTIAITATVRNSGQTSAEGFSATLFDGTPGAGGLSLGTISVGQLQQGGQTQLTWERAFTSGAHFLTAVVDQDARVLEMNESNNQATLPLFVYPSTAVLPDLNLMQLTASPLVPREEDLIAITGSLKNSGTAEAPAFVAELWDGDQAGNRSLLGSFEVAALPAGAQASVTWSGNLAVGSHALWMTADAEHGITETDETNNARTLELRVVPAGDIHPDLSIAPADISYFPLEPTTEDDVWLRAVIHNSGAADAANVIVTYYDGDPAARAPGLGTITLDSIPAGGQATALLISRLTEGEHALHILVDKYEFIPESDETNNRASITLFVAPPLPDLTATMQDLSYAPFSPRAGETVTLSATVRNQGPIEAKDVRVLLQLDEESGGSLLHDAVIPLIPPHGSVTVGAAGVFALGEHLVTLKIDPDATVVERNELNNNTSSAFRVLSWPDLELNSVDVSSTPAFPTSDEKITLRVAVHNIGESRAERVEIGIFDGDPGAGGVLLGETLSIFRVYGNSTVQFEKSFFLSPGMHQLFVVADPNSTVQESVKSNNSVAVSLDVQVKPDLLFEGGLVTYPTTPAEGASVELTALLRNNSTKELENVHVNFFDGDPELGGMPIGEVQIVSSIPAEGNTHVAVQWTFSGGFHEIHTVIDPESQIVESNEKNNALISNLFVTSTLPDVAIHSGEVTCTPSMPESGAGAIFDVAVWNYGPSPVQDVLLRWYDGPPSFGAMLGSQSLTLPAGSKVSASATLVLSAGEHEIYVQVDPDSSLVEANETNNTRKIKVSVVDASGWYDDCGNSLNQTHLLQGSDLQLQDFQGLPADALSANTHSIAVKYRYTGLLPDAVYRLTASFLEETGGGRRQVAVADGIPVFGTIDVPDDHPLVLSELLPRDSYQDGEVTVAFSPSTGAGAIVSQIWLVKETGRKENAINSGLSYLKNNVSYWSANQYAAWPYISMAQTTNWAHAAYHAGGQFDNPRYQMLFDRLMTLQSPDGSWEQNCYITSEILIHLSETGLDPNGPAIAGGAAWLKSQQNTDGGWGDRKGIASSARLTGIGLYALIASGESKVSPSVVKAVQWLKSTQNPSGYWGYYQGDADTHLSESWPAIGLFAATSANDSAAQTAITVYPYLSSSNLGYIYNNIQLFRLYRYTGAASSLINPIIDRLHARQSSDGGWIEKGATYAGFWHAALPLQWLSKSGESGLYEQRGFAWLDSRITMDGSFVNLMLELGTYYSAISLMAHGTSGPLASEPLIRKAEDALLRYAYGGYLWNGSYFTQYNWGNEVSGYVLQAMAVTAYRPSSEDLIVSQSIKYLLDHQNSDGGWSYGGPGSTSTTYTTAAIVRGMLKAGSSSLNTGITKGVQWLLNRQGVDGGWGNTFDTAWTILALQAQGYQPQAVQRAIAWIKESQNADGGWGSVSGEASLTRESALAVLALSECGETGIDVARGAFWLMAAANPDGGWGETAVSGSSGVHATSYAVWALNLARFNTGVELEVLFNKPWYYPSDLVSMVINPLNKTIEEVQLSGQLRDQYGVTAGLQVTRQADSFATEYLVPAGSLPGVTGVNFVAVSDSAQGTVSDTFVVRIPYGTLPDLAVATEDITCSNLAPVSGEALTISATVHNLGLVDALYVIVRAYSGDPAQNGHQIGPDVLLGRVAGLGSAQVQFEWLADPSGRQIFIVVDPDSAVSEDREENNSASRWIHIDEVGHKPDLQVNSSDLSILPPSPYVGELVTVTATVRNVGNSPSVATSLRFYDAEPSVGGKSIGPDVVVPPLGPGEMASVSTTFSTAGLSGRIYRYAVADPDGMVEEISETNNKAFSFVELRQMPLPDLLIPQGAVVLSPTAPLEGESMAVSVTVENRGLAASNVAVALYDGDPSSGGIPIGAAQTIPGIFPQFASRTVIFTWATTGAGGQHRLYAVADPAGSIAETFEDNNSASVALDIAETNLHVEVSTSQAAYGANEPVPISVSVANQGNTSTNATLEVKVQDMVGATVNNVAVEQLSLTAGEVRDLSLIWNTGATRGGPYTVSARLVQDGRTVVLDTAGFTILPDLTVIAAVVTDKVSYGPNEIARVTWSMTSDSANHDFANLVATLTVADSSGATLFSDQRTAASLVRGQRVAFDSYWGTATHPPGSYLLAVRITDGATLLAATTGALTISAQVDPKSLLSGTITATPQTVFSGDAEALAYTVRNIGNRDLTQVHLTIKVVGALQETVFAELTDSAGLAMGAEYAGSQSISTAGYSAEDYLVVLMAEIDGISATLAGSYFRIQGAPSAPSVNSPADGLRISSPTPVLAVNNAADPNSLDDLTYFFELYADPGLMHFVAAQGPLAEGEGTTSWQVALALSENSHYWWRCRAHDGWSYGPWMLPATFFVNAVNDPPGPPVADHPLDGQDVDVLQPSLVVKNALDPDEDSLTYNFLVASDPSLATLVAQTVGVFETPGTTGWQVEQPLSENTWYWWSAQADDWLDVGPWMAPVSFFVNTANDAPTPPVPVAPTDGAETPSSVSLTVENSLDPDSAALTYHFEIDTLPSFTSPALIHSPSLAETVATTSWAVPAQLSENTRYNWRAKASDGQAESPWSTVSSFFVNEVNEAPSTPSLANPSDGGEVIDLQPELSVHNAVDPDGDVLTYDFELYGDAGLATVVASAQAMPEGEGRSTWVLTAPLADNARYWWRSRASDGELASGWMPAASFLVNTANDAPTAPVLAAPANGAVVDLLQPELAIVNALDPDGDLLTYQFEVYGDAGLTVLVASVSATAEGAGVTSWTITEPLQDDRQYWWRSRAFDGECYGPWMVTASFTVHLPVHSIAGTINFDPDTLNLGSRGTWVTVYIELAPGYDVRNILPATVKLNEVVPAETKPVGYGDEDKDGIPDAMLKFRRSAVEAILAPGAQVVVKVTGMIGAMAFEGIDIIRVINP